MSKLEVRTLLVVDDEPLMLEALTDILLPLGISVVQAEDAEQALTILKTTKVTAVLSDIRMPGYSGLEFLEKLRATGNNVPFVFLTASNEKDKMHRALQLGAIDFLEKPFEGDHLKEVVFKLLEIGIRQQELDEIRSTGATNHIENVDHSAAEKLASEKLTKKSKLINLLRIKLPWQKSS